MNRTMMLLPTSVLLALSAGCVPAEEASPTPPAQADTGAADELPTPLDPIVDPEVVVALEAGEPVVALLQLDARTIDRELSRRRSSSDRLPAELREWRAERYVELADELEAVFADRPLQITRRYRNLPVVAVELTELAELDELIGSEMVWGIHAEQIFTADLAQSLAHINQPEAQAAGHEGTGTSVVIFDTGADYRVADLGSCTAPDSGGSCRVKVHQDIAPNDGQLDANGHGTNVAAIVAQVAPGADILDLDVFNGAGASSTDILTGIDWVISNVDTYNIVAMNMCLGGGKYTAECGSTPYETSLALARDAGVLAAIASGNDAWKNAMAAPGCSPSAVSVGAVYDSNMGPIGWSGCSDSSTAADQVTCFSNSTSFLDLLAPGALITAGGHTMGGTSQATPHVAGAMAVVAAAFPSYTPDQIEAQLNTGISITDTNGVTKPRIDLEAAVLDAGSGDGGPVDTGGTDGGGTDGSGSGTDGGGDSGSGGGSADTTAPSGTVTINDGDAYTGSHSVTLTLAATDDVGVTEMCITASTSCSEWETYAETKTYSLNGGTGNRRVKAWFRDAAGNVSERADDIITVDQGAPTMGTLTTTAGDGEISLAWGGFREGGSGLDTYILTASQTGYPGASCTDSTEVYNGTATTTTHTGLTNGDEWYYRLCAVDAVGNVAPGIVARGTAAPELEGPTGTIVAAGGADWTSAQPVPVAITASDASAITEMCLGRVANCWDYVPFAETATVNLGGGVSQRTVYLYLKDEWGNIAGPYTDTVGLDTRAPTRGSLSATRGNQQVALSWGGFRDAGSGVASYKVVGAVGSAPARDCSTGTVVYEGTDTSTTHVGLTNGDTWNYRACAVDAAGNTGGAATTSAMPAPENDAPVGTVTINSGDSMTGDRRVSLSLSATDAGTVTHYCASNNTRCSRWRPLTDTVTWNMSGSGTRSVYVWFKDEWGNESETPVSDDILLDLRRPTDGSVTGSVSGGTASLSWTGFSDRDTGVDHYTVVAREGTRAPASRCTNGTALSAGTSSANMSGMASGATWTFRVCAVDAVGNVSRGTTVQLTN